MFRVHLSSRNDFEAWRTSVRPLLAGRVRPEAVIWVEEGEPESLFAEGTLPPRSEGDVRASRQFLDCARWALCHSAPRRFDLLYRIAYRMQTQSHLLADASDPDVIALMRLCKAVRRDSHKMKAFVRFRALDDTNMDFAAWFEPEHFTLELTAPFFAERFSAMRWAILTPYRSAFWDGHAVTFEAGARRGDAPPEDALEERWRTYFCSIFNPARLKISAMTAEMPRKYWRNLPEAVRIPDLIRTARMRENAMITQGPSTPPVRHVRLVSGSDRTDQTEPVIPSLAAARAAIQSCMRCALYERATQPVFGEGPGSASVMVVGEQPGDSEDLAGRPFVGPAGTLFDKVLAEVRIDRKKLYVTNAVKHFKFLPRGKRRLHQKPNGGEISACRFWLDHERALIKPKVILAMGASAAQAVIGKPITVGKLRGAPIPLEDGTTLFVTVHPSYLLRIPERDRAGAERQAFARDLAALRDFVESNLEEALALDSAIAGP